MTRVVRVSAPGKLMITGEYAVLYGFDALVAAVDARATATLAGSTRDGDGSRPGSSGSPEIPLLSAEGVVARRAAEQALGIEVDAELSIDVTDLRRAGRKVGLGSSAAGAAAAAAAVHAWAGADLGAEATRAAVLRDALAGHHEVAPEGSGADVAASTLGGFLRFKRHGTWFRVAQSTKSWTVSDTEPGSVSSVIAESIEWPAEVVVRVVWTGVEARTSDFVRAVRELEAREPARHRAAMEAMGAASHVMVHAARHGDARGVIDAADAYGRRMGELGAASGVPIVTPALERVAELARAEGGAAKPSGAGGGDVAVAFFAGDDRARAFDAACASTSSGASEKGLEVLPLALGADGIRLERRD